MTMSSHLNGACAHLREVIRKPHTPACLASHQHDHPQTSLGSCRARARNGAKVQRPSGNPSQIRSPAALPQFAIKRDRKRYTITSAEDEGAPAAAEEVEVAEEDPPRTSGAATG
jgi:hypothetical protein